MQNYSTIVGVIRLRLENVPYNVIRQRYKLGNSTVTLIMSRFTDSGMTYSQLCQLDPPAVENLFFPQENLRRKDIPMPDFQSYYDRIMAKGSKVNIAYCWMEYKSEHPDGYEASQFYEYFRRFVNDNYGDREVSMPVERVPGERMYIDWVGDKPEILVNPETGELSPVSVFVTTIGVSSKVFAEVFPDEKLACFIKGTTDAIEFYGAVPRYLVPDNCRTAVKKHSRDEIILNTAYKDLEDFYDVVVLPPPPNKPKGKPTVENHVRTLETHLLEKLREKVYTSIEAINDEVQKIIADINDWRYQKKVGTRNTSFDKYDLPHMKPLPGGKYVICDYKCFTRVPDNYHLEYDGHYYSVLYTYHGKPAILKATLSEIRICDSNNRLICTHRRSYRTFPLYITDASHMKPEHLYYKELNEKDGAYYRRWAAVFGPYMSELIDTVLKAAEHEEQAYNSCAGILHQCKNERKDIVEEAARKCVEMHSCKYSAFKKALSALRREAGNICRAGTFPDHDNIRGREHFLHLN